MARDLVLTASMTDPLVAGVGAESVVETARAKPTPKTFVLVHGAFCGSWIWRRVADQLEKSGHKVFVPALTGLGERSHLLSREVNLDTHIADIVNLIKWENLNKVCLVAWSYAGFVGAGALETIGDRVSSLVWLDAFLPTHGQKVVDLTAFGEIVQKAIDRGEAGFGPPPMLPPAFVSERDRSFAESKITAQPTGTFVQPIKLSAALKRVEKKTYIRLTKFPQPNYDKVLAECKGDKSWTTFELADAGHMAMLDAPDRVSELILHSA